MTAGGGAEHEGLAPTIVAALDRLARGQRSFRQAVASDLKLTPLQVEILSTIAAGPPPQPLVGLLARELGVSQPTITDAAAVLESKGLLRRRIDDGDRRRSVLSLTRRGAQVVERITAADRRIVEAIGAASSAAQADAVEALFALIARLVDAGIIDVARTCTTCRYLDAHRGRRRCRLLEIDLGPAELRVNCPEHEPSTAD